MKGLLLLAALLFAQNGVKGRITAAGVARAQAVVDSVFLDKRISEGIIEGGDWAAYLMARLGVSPLPDSIGMTVTVDSAQVRFSGRLRDLPAEARAQLGPIAALVDSNTVLTADVVQVPSMKGLAHFQLRGVNVGGFPIPEVMLRSMLMTIGDRYPALTKSGRDLFVQIPVDGRVALVSGAVRLNYQASP
ncbi:MAG: hypothetical protein HOP28_05115 [Gemmatimonadales bacterium]|nr:hypothetical protein [Gemmatimonadales bacterium]